MESIAINPCQSHTCWGNVSFLISHSNFKNMRGFKGGNDSVTELWVNIPGTFFH